MTALAEQVELLRFWYPLSEFDQERPDETAQEKKLRGFIYVALARIEEVEQANARLRRNAMNRAPEPVSALLEEVEQSRAPLRTADDTPPVPGAPQRVYRGGYSRWRGVCEPSPFNKYRRDQGDNQDEVAEPMEGQAHDPLD